MALMPILYRDVVSDTDLFLVPDGAGLIPEVGSKMETAIGKWVVLEVINQIHEDRVLVKVAPIT